MGDNLLHFRMPSVGVNMVFEYYDDELFSVLERNQYYISDGDAELGCVIGSDVKCIEDMGVSIQVVMSIIAGESYKVQAVKGGYNLNDLGRKIVSSLSIEPVSVMAYFESNTLSEYFHVFAKARQGLRDDGLLFQVCADSYSRKVALEAVDKFASVVMSLAGNAIFRRRVREYERCAKNNSAGMNELIDSIFTKHSKVLVLRVDFGYSLPYLHSLAGVVCSERVRRDMARFIKDLNKSVLKKGLLGYLWKLEFGPMKQFHYHCMFFLNGSKFQKDIVIASKLGEHWKSVVTNGDGVYFNCNNDKESYPYQALGEKLRSDPEGVGFVKKAAEYLVKLDWVVRPNLPSGRRTFGRSQALKVKL